jgi:hypothetical protein
MHGAGSGIKRETNAVEGAIIKRSIIGPES